MIPVIKDLYNTQLSQLQPQEIESLFLYGGSVETLDAKYSLACIESTHSLMQLYGSSQRAVYTQHILTMLY